MLRGIQKVGFDIDGTMYQRTAEIDGRIQTEIAKRILEKKPELGDVGSALEFFQEQYATGRKGGRTILREVGYDDSSRVMDQCIVEADVIDLIPRDNDLVSLVSDLSKRYALFVITSNPKDVALRKLERLGLNAQPYFDFLVCNENGDKRSGEAFEHVIAMSICEGISPYAHLYVGDSPDADISPASTVGMRTVLIDPKTQIDTHEQLRSIRSLRELLL